jgi:flagellar hook-associated protein FlgK
MSNVARITKLNDKIAKLNTTIENATEQRDELVKELSNIEALANVGVGSRVTFFYGRAVKDKETGEVVKPRELLTGVVTAQRVVNEGTDDEQRQFKVESGEGFDAKVAILTEGQIESVVTEQAE